jgi:hypothetical protein
MKEVSNEAPGKVPGGHPWSGFRRHRADEQGCSLPPPAPPASLSLLPSRGRLGVRCGLQWRSEPGKRGGPDERSLEVSGEAVRQPSMEQERSLPPASCAHLGSRR